MHYNVSQPPGMDKAAFLALWERMSARVHNLAATMDGSISAEHGIGQMKRDELRRFKSPIELDLMRRIKTAFDPKGILNPGKLFCDAVFLEARKKTTQRKKKPTTEKREE